MSWVSAPLNWVLLYLIWSPSPASQHSPLHLRMSKPPMRLGLLRSHPHPRERRTRAKLKHLHPLLFLPAPLALRCVPSPPKLAAAREAMGMSWVPITNKQKTGLPQKEVRVLVKMAKTFPATTTIALQQVSSTVTGCQAPTPSEACRKCQKKYTTQSRSRKSVSVYSSPPFTWKEDVIFNQINSHLGNAKHSIHVTGIESSRKNSLPQHRCRS